MKCEVSKCRNVATHVIHWRHRKTGDCDLVKSYCLTCCQTRWRTGFITCGRCHGELKMFDLADDSELIEIIIEEEPSPL